MGSPDPQTYRVSVDQIIPRVWVGNQACASSCEFIAREGITLVVNCTAHLPCYHKRKCRCKARPRYLRVPVGDPGPPETPGWNGTRDIETFYRLMPFICKAIHEEWKRGGKILIHCHAGAQRSAGMAAGLLMRYHCRAHLSQDERYAQAVKWIVRHRPIAFFGGTSVNFKEALAARPIMVVA